MDWRLFFVKLWKLFWFSTAKVGVVRFEDWRIIRWHSPFLSPSFRPATSAGDPTSIFPTNCPGLFFSACRLKPKPSKLSTLAIWQSLGWGGSPAILYWDFSAKKITLQFSVSYCNIDILCESGSFSVTVSSTGSVDCARVSCQLRETLTLRATDHSPALIAGEHRPAYYSITLQTTPPPIWGKTWDNHYMYIIRSVCVLSQVYVYSWSRLCTWLLATILGIVIFSRTNQCNAIFSQVSRTPGLQGWSQQNKCDDNLLQTVEIAVHLLEMVRMRTTPTAVSWSSVSL